MGLLLDKIIPEYKSIVPQNLLETFLEGIVDNCKLFNQSIKTAVQLRIYQFY